MSEGAAGQPEQTEKQPTPAVAAVLTTDQVVLNVGRRHGVQIGQRYLIYVLSEDEVTDPYTGESLGRVEIPKGTGKIASVQKRMAVLQSDRELSGGQRSAEESLTLGISELMMPGRMAPFRGAAEGDRVKRLY